MYWDIGKYVSEKITSATTIDYLGLSQRRVRNVLMTEDLVVRTGNYRH